jgi:hydrogenase nickel incorporation protein HypA/HybF
MHEMSLVESMIELIESESRTRGFARVRTVRLAVGALGHVEPEAMRFCFDAVTRGTIAEGARLEIRTVPGEAWCLDCGKRVAIAERYGACPECGRHQVQITGGDALRLEELEVD